MHEVAHVGIDLAWGPRNRTGIAAVDERGALTASATLVSDDDIVAWIERHAPRAGVVAMDAPLIVENEDGPRPAEVEISRAFGAFEASAHTSNLKTEWFRPPRAATLARRLGLGIDPSMPQREHVAIEVYPHPAMIGLFELGRTLKYKRKKQGFEVQHAETRRLLALMEERLPVMRLAANDDWRGIVTVVDAAVTPGALGKVEDEIDGIFCAHLAWLWARGGDELQVYGDVESGYIVAPPPPTWAPTARPAKVVPRSAGDHVGMTSTARRRSSAHDVAMTWDRLERLLIALPEGRWTTYGDVAAALDHHAQPVSGRIAAVRPGAYWRVIRVDGTVSKEFTWADGRKDAQRPVLAELAREGVPTVDGRADASKRLSVAELRAILAHDA